MSVAAGNKQYAASFNLFLVLFCMPALFEVTNRAVACWWQVLFSAFGFGTVLCAELQIAGLHSLLCYLFRRRDLLLSPRQLLISGHFPGSHETFLDAAEVWFRVRSPILP